MEKCCCSILQASVVLYCNCTPLMGSVELVKADLLQNLHLKCFRELYELRVLVQSVWKCWNELELEWFFCSIDTTLPPFIVWNFALAQQGQNRTMSTGLVLYMILRRNHRKSKPFRYIICVFHLWVHYASISLLLVLPFPHLNLPETTQDHVRFPQELNYNVLNWTTQNWSNLAYVPKQQ